MKEIACNDKSTKEKANAGFLNRFSKVFFIIAIIVAVLTLLALAMSVLTPLLTVVIMVVIILAIILIVVCTLGTIFATDKNPIPKLWSAFKSVSNSTNLVKKISQICLICAKWLSLAGVILAIISLVLVSASKCKYKVLKIIVLALLAIILGVFFIYQIV